jgi:hypothetical protein
MAAGRIPTTGCQRQRRSTLLVAIFEIIRLLNNKDFGLCNNLADFGCGMPEAIRLREEAEAMNDRARLDVSLSRPWRSSRA